MPAPLDAPATPAAQPYGYRPNRFDQEIAMFIERFGDRVLYLDAEHNAAVVTGRSNGRIH